MGIDWTISLLGALGDSPSDDNATGLLFMAIATLGTLYATARWTRRLHDPRSAVFLTIVATVLAFFGAAFLWVFTHASGLG